MKIFYRLDTNGSFAQSQALEEVQKPEKKIPSTLAEEEVTKQIKAPRQEEETTDEFATKNVAASPVRC